MTETRPGRGTVERRRLCTACGHRFRTLEERCVVRVSVVRVSRLRAAYP